MTAIQKKEDLIVKLKAIRPFVREDVRVRWALDNNKSRITVYNYLGGRIGEILVAEKMLNDLMMMAGITTERLKEILLENAEKPEEQPS
jgi:hypothetical protein